MKLNQTKGFNESDLHVLSKDFTCSSVYSEKTNKVLIFCLYPTLKQSSHKSAAMKDVNSLGFHSKVQRSVCLIL